MDDGPEEWFALEFDPGEVRGGDVVEVLQKADLELGLCEEPVGDDSQGGLKGGISIGVMFMM